MHRLLALLLLSVALAGCSFSRTVVNGHVRNLDTSWIEPGKTTRAEVIARFGRPPAMVGAKGVRVGTGGALGALLGHLGQAGGGLVAVGMDAEGEMDGLSSNALRWYANDTYVKMFEGGWIIYPTFSSQRHQRGHDLYILFDRNGVVKLLSRTETTDDGVKLLEWKEARR